MAQPSPFISMMEVSLRAMILKQASASITSTPRLISIQALLVPAAQDIERFEINDNIAWILVVEKDVSFLLHSYSQ